jgi:hypothetical protein
LVQDYVTWASQSMQPEIESAAKLTPDLGF